MRLSANRQGNTCGAGRSVNA
ncbi:protein YbiE [Escherichia coli]